MSKFSSFFEKVGLIERDPSELADELIARNTGPSSSSGIDISSARDVLGEQAPTPEPVVIPTGTEPTITEGTAFDHIFAAAAVPTAPFPVERLIKLIEGLKQLDAPTQIAAIKAMDAADETWTIDSVLEDANQKIAAIDAYKRNVSGNLSYIETQNNSRIGEIDAAKDAEVNRIREEISALEKNLEQAVASHSAEVAQLKSEVETARSAATREHRRVDAQIDILRQIVAPFSNKTTATKTKS